MQGSSSLCAMDSTDQYETCPQKKTSETCLTVNIGDITCNSESGWVGGVPEDIERLDVEVKTIFLPPSYCVLEKIKGIGTYAQRLCATTSSRPHGRLWNAHMLFCDF